MLIKCMKLSIIGFLPLEEGKNHAMGLNPQFPVFSPNCCGISAPQLRKSTIRDLTYLTFYGIYQLSAGWHDNVNRIKRIKFYNYEQLTICHRRHTVNCMGVGFFRVQRWIYNTYIIGHRYSCGHLAAYPRRAGLIWKGLSVSRCE